MSDIKFNERVEGCYNSHFFSCNIIYGRFIVDASKCDNHTGEVARYLIMTDEGRVCYKSHMRRASKVATVDGVEYKISDDMYLAIKGISIKDRF